MANFVSTVSPSLKVVTSAGIICFANGVFSTTDEQIIKELKASQGPMFRMVDENIAKAAQQVYVDNAKVTQESQQAQAAAQNVPAEDKVNQLLNKNATAAPAAAGNKGNKQGG
jgi:hypothetical protein